MFPFSSSPRHLVLVLCSVMTAAAAASASFRLATWNLRYDSMPNNITVQQSLAALPDPLQQPAYFNLTGEQPWSTRRIKVAQRLLSEGISLAGFQEGLVRQVNDLAELLGDDWAWVGVGRDDGVAAGEFSPIFYKKNTPFVAGSKFPGAGSVRIATATHLRLRATGQAFTYINTHLDDQSDAQRQLGASLILWRARYQASIDDTAPVLVTGDFNRCAFPSPFPQEPPKVPKEEKKNSSRRVHALQNSPATGTDSGAYRIITGALAPVPINQTFIDRFPIANHTLPDFTTLDVRTQAPSHFAVSGNFGTYTGFTAPGDASQYTHIDFIFGGSNGRWSIQAFKVETSLTDDGVIASDHRPVFGDITLS
ncbi:hypothetical protein EW146_g7386 [Bondarzewia mesenterica]|uniref:Uncharacterized protein n=1 Tax=Bondarzewia mesenterica TaxID=1095465 RepID=A0A4S4LKX3_9AGAM|nr:hypothetical protein EW146_g7386 [Bondarzewia mesenterica]